MSRSPTLLQYFQSLGGTFVAFNTQPGRPGLRRVLAVSPRFIDQSLPEGHSQRFPCRQSGHVFETGGHHGKAIEPNSSARFTGEVPRPKFGPARTCLGVAATRSNIGPNRCEPVEPNC